MPLRQAQSYRGAGSNVNRARVRSSLSVGGFATTPEERSPARTCDVYLALLGKAGLDVAGMLRRKRWPLPRYLVASVVVDVSDGK